VSIDWSGYHAAEQRRRVSLPTYPFERRRHWVDPEPAQAVAGGAPGKRSDLADWFYTPSWRRAALRAAIPPVARCWLVLLDEHGLGAAIVGRVRAAGARVVTVEAGQTFAGRGPDDYVIDPDESADYLRLVTALTPAGRMPLRILDLRSVVKKDADDPASRAFYGPLFLAQALAECRVREAVEILVVSNGLYDVTGEPVHSPARAAVLGPCIVLPQELANLTCRLVDVAFGEDESDRDDVAGQIIGELDQPLEGTVAAYRGGHRWILDYEPVPLPAAASDGGLRPGGVYLITGGFGGIGSVLARHLAESVGAKLVLVGRGQVPDDPASPRTALLRELEALGAEVLALSADVSRPEQVMRVVEAARARFGRIDGVIHAAGLAGGGIVQLKTRPAADAVLQPKLAGAAALLAALADAPPDFVLLCSSITAILGGPGQIDYCGANSVLDAFARRAGAGAPRVISVNWDAWREVGMAVNTAVPAAMRKQRAVQLADAIASAEGVEAFRRILASGLHEVVVSTHEFRALLAVAQRLGRAREASSVDSPAPTPARAAAADPAPRSTPAAPPTTDLERTIARIWEELLGIQDVGIHDDFFEAGGHSLLATQVMARLHKQLLIDVPLRELFETRTISAFAERVASLLAVDEDREEIEL
jgi:NAD(P)-dependent dehydrogenase (short-subunit alcohol dehydrogenase family)